MNEMRDYESYLAYQEYTNAKRLDFAAEVGLIATATLVMPIEAMPYRHAQLTKGEQASAELTPTNQETFPADRLSHIAVASSVNVGQSLERAINPADYRLAA